jgi:glutaminyl-tRNA synthetase
MSTPRITEISKNPAPATQATGKEPAKASNFLRQIIEHDLATGTYSGRTWGHQPGTATEHAQAPGAGPDPARIRTRFPPSPTATCTWATPRASA